MKWFYKLERKKRMIITVVAWIISTILLIILVATGPENSDDLETWRSILLLICCAVPIFFTVFAVLASKKDKEAAAKAKADDINGVLKKDDYNSFNIAQIPIPKTAVKLPNGSYEEFLDSEILRDGRCLIVENDEKCQCYHTHVGCYKKWSVEARNSYYDHGGWKLMDCDDAKKQGYGQCILCFEELEERLSFDDDDDGYDCNNDDNFDDDDDGYDCNNDDNFDDDNDDYNH